MSSYRYGTCQLAGCHNPKHRWGRYCQRHRKALACYGHPNGRPVAPNEIFHWAVKARRVLDAHAETHEGIKLAVAELSRALNEALARDETSPRHSAHPRSRSAIDRNVVSHFARLARKGVTALDVLMMVVAVALLDQSDARRFPDSRSYRYAIARAVLGLVSRGPAKAIGSSTLDNIGTYLADRYSALMGVVARAVVEAEHRDTIRRVAMSAPLQTST